MIILCPLIGLSQYVDMWHFSVPSDETNIYEATEKEWFAKVMSKAAKNGLINGWGMSRRVGKKRSISDDQHTLRLGKIAQQENIFVAYHGHTQQTPTFWDVALKQSEYNAMNIDIGHYVAAGNTEPLEIIKNKHNYIKSMHIKDRTRPNRGQLNLPWGKGDTPIEEVLRLMRDKKYDFAATIEYEYKTPKNSDVLKEIKKCIAYCKNALDS